MLFTPEPTDAARYKKAKAQTFGEIAISEAKMAKTTVHRRHQLAAAPVGPQGQGHRPQQLGHLGHEGDAAERGVVDVERRLEVVADEAMPLPKVPGTMAAAVSRTKGA